MKHIIRFFLFLFVLIFSNEVFSQYVRQEKEPEKSLPAKYIIKFSPLSLVDFNHNSVQAAFEHRVQKNFTLQHELGIIFPITDYDYENTGFRIRNELRFYLPTRKRVIYFALDVLFLNAEYKDFSGYFYFSEPPMISHPYTYDVVKKVYATHLKFGVQPKIKRLVMDFYVGPGVRYVSIDHVNSTLPRGAIVENESWHWGNDVETEGGIEKLSISAGFKVGYVLKR